VLSLECHEQGKIIEPLPVRLDERGQAGVIVGEPLEGQAQQVSLEGNDRVKVNVSVRERRGIAPVFGAEPTVGREELGADQERVAGERRVRLVR
jgi:hypothetical protein